MIKFFRKIRQNLLMENKTGKYFKYAIGEIVLVVIGILIALQINNWNESRKDNVAEKIALTNLELDIKENISRLQTHLKSQEVWIQDCISILNHLEKENRFIGEDTLIRQINDLLVRSNSGQANTTYETLKSTGKLNLIRNENLKKEIVLYYNYLQNFSNNTTNNNTNLIDGLINPELIKYTVFQSHDFTENLKTWWPTLGIINYEMKNTDHLRANLENYLSNHDEMLKFLNIVNFRLFLATIQKEFALEIVQKSENLLETVRKELKNFKG